MFIAGDSYLLKFKILLFIKFQFFFDVGNRETVLPITIILRRFQNSKYRVQMNRTLYFLHLLIFFIPLLKRKPIFQP